eukprot:GHVN01092520.1.p2 GENE.GHVN01092520.1~~GHVN01092520.1.p2  ORF type:complete len:122 (+),score=24.73 GHVN01092520.1:399-764(+)
MQNLRCVSHAEFKVRITCRFKVINKSPCSGLYPFYSQSPFVPTFTTYLSHPLPTPCKTLNPYQTHLIHLTPLITFTSSRHIHHLTPTYLHAPPIPILTQNSPPFTKISYINAIHQLFSVSE